MSIRIITCSILVVFLCGVHSRATGQTSFHSYLADTSFIASTTEETLAQAGNLEFRSANRMNDFSFRAIELYLLHMTPRERALTDAILADIRKDNRPVGAAALSPTVVIDALSRTIARRAADEVTMQAVGLLTRRLNDDALRPYSVLMSETKRFLTSIDVRRYASILPALRDAVEYDLRQLPHTIPRCLDEMGKQGALDSSAARVVQQVVVVHTLLASVLDGGNPAEALTTIMMDPSFATLDAAMQAAVSIARTSLLLMMEDGRPIDLAPLFMSGSRTVDAYFTARLVSVWFEENSAALMRITVPQSDGTVTSLHALIQDRASGTGYSQRVISAVLRLHRAMRQLSEREKALKSSIAGRVPRASDIAPLDEAMIETAVALFSVTTGVTNGMRVHGSIDGITARISEMSEIMTAIRLQNYGFAVARTLVLLKDAGMAEEQYPVLFDILTFAANAANADDADELSQALQAFFLPSGSFRVKRDAQVTVALNSYVGAAFANGRSPGFGTPLGLEASFGLGKGWSIGVLGSIVDLGPVVNFRLQSEDGPIPELRWSDVLAPGAHVVLGLPWFISVGAGWQQAPRLVAISAAEEIRYRIAQQRGLHGFIAVDIPLYHVYVVR